MSTTDGSNGTGGGGAPGPGSGSGAGPGGGSTAATSGEPLKIIKTQLIPHPHPASLQHHQQQSQQKHHQHHSPLPSPTRSSPVISLPASTTTTLNSNNTNSQQSQPPSIQLKNPTNVTNLFSLNPVAAKITHVKTTLDAGVGLNLSGLASAGGGNMSGSVNASTLVSSGALSTVGAIKVGNSGAVATSITGAPIALNASQATGATGATSIRAIGAGGQSTQVRVVMGNIMTPSMIKQLENVGPGRTQITAFPTAPVRSVSNTSITVTRTATQATYLPRANVTATQMTGVGVSVPAGQRLVTPIRTTPASVAASSTGATVTGITAAGNFVRGTAVSRNNSSPATTVISPATSTTWMAANPTGQVQLIRAIPHQSRQRIIATQGLSGAPISAASSIASVSGTVVTNTASAIQSNTVIGQHQQQTPVSQHQSASIQAVSSAGSQHQQQTYVATVLPPRQHQATLVYSSNMATSQSLNAQPQSFHPTSVGTTGPRFAVATPLTATSGTTGVPRQIRPIPFAKSFSAAKLNTTSISIRAPNLPQLAPTISSGVSNVTASIAASHSPRSNTVTGVTASAANVLPSTTTRIIQLQQQPGGTTQQIIGSTGRLAANVMLQPIIVNTSAAGKIGIRPPVTMAAKVQPSLTITQLGIGKLSSSTGSIQQNPNASSGSASPSISTANITATNLSSNTTTQLVNVSQGTSSGQLLTTQNIMSSTSAVGTAAGGATVVPLAITARNTGGGNIITGTMTPIKNASSITVGKVMTQSHLPSSMECAAGQNSANTNNNTTVTPTNVFIHHAPVPQRPHSNSSTSSNSASMQSNLSAVPNSVTGNVLTSTGNVGTGTFLQPGSTIYYESVPASSVQVSTGVLSLTTTTITSSTISQSQTGNTASNLSISTLPFVTQALGNTTTATYTVVPSLGGRTIGQLQIPVSSAGTQIQTVPVRFSQLSAAGSNIAVSAADSIAVSQAGTQMLAQTATGETSQLLLPSSQAQQNLVVSSGSSQQQQPQHTHQMVIPLQTSIKVTSGGVGTSGTAIVSNYLGKRSVDGSPIRAAKNLQPTLLSMASAASSSSNVPNSSPASSSMGSTYSLTSITSSGTSSILTAETLARKDRIANQSSTPNTSALPSRRTSRAHSTASSDGSTTVSANSSPGVEQQIQDNNMIINRLPGGGPNIESHFNPINELYSNHHSVVQQQNTTPATPSATSRNVQSMDQRNMPGPMTIQQRLNGGVIDCPPRKKLRRATVDSHFSSHSHNHTSLNLPPPQANNVVPSVPNSTTSHESNMIPNTICNGSVTSMLTGQTNHDVVNGKENTKPVEYILKRPKNCTLMSTYKQSWKSAYNHFQRYSDVKPREERRPTIMDLANQTNVLGKINGWKIYHLKSQMEDLCENESLGYEKLASMLKHMESNGISNEIERISDLLKGNMQRSKIIVDGVSEAQNQIMKIFEHKSHVSDIINRCASKRNYKKREKV